MSQVTNPLFKFEKAKRVQCKASIMIEGLPGKGKSGLALLLGYYLAEENWDKVAAIDTENGSLKLFADIPSSAGNRFQDFNIGELTPDIGYKPSHYLAFRDVAIKNGATVVIEDSVSHAWMYKGGILDLVNEAKKKDKRYEKDSYAAWGEETVAREKLVLLDLLRDYRCHVITTVRVKEKMDYDKDEQGKTKLVSLGEQQIMQADIKFEPDLVLRMVSPGKARANSTIHPKAEIVKSRYAIFTEGEVYDFTPELMIQLRAYLEAGVSPEELLEKQRQEYISGVTAYLNAHQNAVPIWQVMKKDAGFETTKLDELPLEAIKRLFIRLTIE